MPPPPNIAVGWDSPIAASAAIVPITSANLTQSSVTASILQQQTQPIPTFFDRLETYRQFAANKGPNNTLTGLLPTLAANTIVSQSPLAGGGYTTSLVERTQDLRNWLQKAKSEHELLSTGQQHTNL